MYTVKYTGSFKKDLKSVEKRGYRIELLEEVVEKLANNEILPENYRDHALSGNYEGCRECHIRPDWLLIYRVNKDILYLYLTRTGTHSDLF